MAILEVDTAVSIPLALKGRAIVQIALSLIGFWSRHRATLSPAIDPRLTAILDDLADAVNLVKQILSPGPQ